eukprot:Anaeramoba_ignava/c15084_g1_i1.p2 GENE.c15084_g1_i1~~c15084_g1_i1.p2  ORF type:complete len:129 (+),score=39.20 c15084_g1_i1:3-389(+)
MRGSMRGLQRPRNPSQFYYNPYMFPVFVVPPRMQQNQRRQRKKPVKKSETEIHVSNISDNLTSEQLKEIFKSLSVKEARIAYGLNQRSRGFGFVNFETHEDQLKALKLNGQIVQGKRIFIQSAFEKKN